MRRRIRDKRAIKEFKCLEGTLDDSDTEDRKKQRVIFQVIEDEMKRIYDDDWSVVGIAMEKVMQLRKLAEILETTTEEVLQTRIVGVKEVVRDWSKWLPAVQSEVDSLLVAFKKLSKTEFHEFKKRAAREGKKVEELPSKVVGTLKPDPSQPLQGKRKVRWVICGNYETEKEEVETYSGGADSTALRMLVKKAAVSRWEGATMDVKTAFLNAALDEDQSDYIAVRPPGILVAQGFMSSDEIYIAQKAVYGLKRSPRLWGLTRDRELHRLRVEDEGEIYMLEPLLSEPHLWKVISMSAEEEEDVEAICGLLMTYVDDLFMVSRRRILLELIKGIRSLWKTTDPEFVGQVPIRFLGMDISKEETEDGAVWKVTQNSYSRDMLQKEKGLVPRRVSITRDQSLEIEEEGGPEKSDIGLIREAQRQVGELLWTVTRTRPDLMYAVSKLGSAVLRNPKMVNEVAIQVKGYMLTTEGEGLSFSPDDTSNPLLEVFTDASYGDHAHGCVVAFLFGSPMLWKSGKQGTASMSKGEAELQEIVEGMVAGESTFVLAREIFSEMGRVLWTDSQAAQSILTNEGGSWRTRHLRLRAADARMKRRVGDWTLAWPSYGGRFRNQGFDFDSDDLFEV